MENKVLVRILEEQDIFACAVIERETFSEPWSAASFASSLEKPDTLALAAIYMESVVGYLVAENISDEIDLYNLAVVPAMRKKMVGSMLLQTLIMQAHALHAKQINLEVRVSNTPAICLYKKYGFRQVGLRKGFYRLPTEDAILMTLLVSEDKLDENSCH